MGDSGEVGAERRVRRWRSVAEKRQIVKQTLEPCASVALVARAHGLNANQVFKWRRAFERGELVDSAGSSTALLAVRIGAPSERVESGSEQRRRAMISVESGADPALLRSILESLRK